MIESQHPNRRSAPQTTFRISARLATWQQLHPIIDPTKSLPAVCPRSIGEEGHNSCPLSVHSPSLSQWIDHKYGALSAITLNIKLESSRIKQQIQALLGKWPLRADFSVDREIQWLSHPRQASTTPLCVGRVF